MQREPSAFLNAYQAGELLGLSVSTLAKWRLSGIGPRYSKLGRRIIYQRCEIEVWIAQNQFRSTSEYDLRDRGGIR